jgi:carbamoyltransferase
MSLTQIGKSAETGDGPTYVLGISEAHNCTAVLLRDGEIIAVASEERFTRFKNDTGYPRQAVEFVLSHAGIASDELDLVVLTYDNPYPHFGVAIDHVDPRQQAAETGARRVTSLRRAVHSSAQFVYGMGSSNRVASRLLDFLEKNVYEHLYAPAVWPRLRRIQYRDLAAELGVPESKIQSADHHLCHAVSALYFGPVPEGRTIVLTLDGAGDDCCATVSVAENGTLKRLAQTPNLYSLGIFYTLVTRAMGMKAGEHEYKVMGLAPYADEEGVKRVLPIFEDLLQVDGMQFRGPTSTRAAGHRLERSLHRQRFDWIAGAAQQHCENLMREFAQNALEATGAVNLLAAGGVFMNVKANMILKDLPGLQYFGVCPSAGDESTAIGAAYHGYQMLTGKAPLPLSDLYLGPDLVPDEIEAAIRDFGLADSCDIRQPEDVDLETAKMLRDGQIVARCQGRMEFGARALGNRSILANPSSPEVVPIINHQIKQRDFWMPFAGTLLDESQHRYIKNPTNLPSPHMMTAFDTLPEAQADLAAAIHPFDKTMRPQILRQTDNPGYHALIRSFEDLTGIGAVLNTSFNLHGEPVVCSAADAVKTFMGSGLQNLSLGPYMISKNREG